MTYQFKMKVSGLLQILLGAVEYLSRSACVISTEPTGTGRGSFLLSIKPITSFSAMRTTYPLTSWEVPNA